MPGRMAGFAVSLAKELNMTPFDVRWRLYLPEALQCSHALLYGQGAWTVALAPPVTAQIAALTAAPAADLSAL